MTEPLSWVPDACTLPTAEQPLRQAEFDELFAAAARSVHRDGPADLTVILDAGPGRAELVRDLVRRETECCSFFTFRLDDGDPLRLHAAVPPPYADVLDALAERAARSAGSRA